MQVVLLASAWHTHVYDVSITLQTKTNKTISFREAQSDAEVWLDPRSRIWSMTAFILCQGWKGEGTGRAPVGWPQALPPLLQNKCEETEPSNRSLPFSGACS